MAVTRTARLTGAGLCAALAFLVACTVTAVIAPRSRFAGPAFTVTGLITLALRLPGLWIADADALVTTLLTLALATGLVLTAIVGRGPDGPDGAGVPRPRAGQENVEIVAVPRDADVKASRYCPAGGWSSGHSPGWDGADGWHGTTSARPRTPKR
ncbi:hypothetical protein AB0C52_21315 [Streptomyces sp. NPDC048717]|uniref:hypothetical protein n=1 Tax=Streptomyces sp. NPDC048717 TaxID=3154928 RepID=UPI00342223AD